MNHKVVTGIVRLAYVNGLREKSAPPGSERLRFNVNVLINKDDKFTLDQMEKAFNDAKREGREKLWGNKAPATLKFENFLKDRSEESEQEIWENVLVAVPKTDYDVKIIGPDNETFDTKGCYDGMNARVSMGLYPYKHESGGKGIGIQLNGIKIVPGGDQVELTYDITKDFEDEFEENNTADAEKESEGKKRRRRRG
jgi:hypothetical protein